MEVSIPLDARGPRFMARTGVGLAAAGVFSVVSSVLTGGTEVYGVYYPAAVGVIGGAFFLILGLLGWHRSRRRRKGCLAIWSEGDVLFLHAHAGPVARIRADDLKDVTRVCAPSDAQERFAFGSGLFTVHSNVSVSPGTYEEVPVGERFVTDIDAARDEILDWVQARRKTV